MGVSNRYIAFWLCPWGATLASVCIGCLDGLDEPSVLHQHLSDLSHYTMSTSHSTLSCLALLGARRCWDEETLIPSLLHGYEILDMNIVIESEESNEI